MGRNLKILLSTFALMLVYCGYYFGLPALVNLPRNAGVVENLVKQKTGYRIKLENPELKTGLIPSIIISAGNAAILNDDGSAALNIENLKFSVKLLPLIFKNIDIESLSANKTDIYLVFDKDGFKLGQYRLDSLPESDFNLRHLTAEIGDYNIYLDDKIQSKKLTTDGQYLTVKDYTNGKTVEISTSAELVAGAKKSYIKTDLKLPLNKVFDDQFRIDGHIANLDLSDFSEYAKSLSKGQIKSTSGQINFTAKTNAQKDIETYLAIKNLGIFKENIEESIYSKDKLELKSIISVLNNGINIENMELSGESINAGLSGQITKINSKFPELDLKINIDDTKAEKVLTILPGEHDIDPDIDILLLKKAGFWGDVKGELEIKGKADYPDISGDITVRNAYMVKPIANAEKAVIELLFKGDYFDLDVNVPTGNNQIVKVKGPIKLDKERTADLQITSTRSVDLKTAQIVLNPLHEILHFDLGPVPIMDIQGKGGIDLHITGSRENPHGWGQFWFNNAIVSFNDIKNMQLVNGSGTLDFDDQNTLFQSKTAILNGKPVSVKGTCTLLGDLNFNIIANGQDLGKLLKTVQTSPMLTDIQELRKPVENVSGNANLKLNLTGQVKDINDIVFNKNIFAKGTIELLSNSIKLKDLPSQLSGTTGTINFDNLNADFDIKTGINNSQFSAKGKLKDKICNVVISSQKFNISDALKAVSFPYSKDFEPINTSFTAKYSGNIENIEFDRINVKGKIFTAKNDKISLNNSGYELSNSNLKIPSLNGTFNGSPFNLTLNASKIFSKTPVINGYAKINSLDLSIINDLKNILPETELDNIEIINGKTDIAVRARNNNLNVFTVLNDISLLYKPYNVKAVITGGSLFLQNSTLNLNKINAKLGEMPVFIDGKIYNVQKNPNLNLYLNAKPTQEFFDILFNKNSIYPIKMKGDIILSSKINGTLNNLNAKSVLDIKENSNLYYMGAAIGDVENPVQITVDDTYIPDKLRINNLRYDKIIMSQNNKPYVNTQLNASGTLSLPEDNNVGFNNFRIKTQNPTDAKIFNIIFRKPFMKQGVFTSDIVLNGTSLNPKINGKLDITSIDIPFFDSTIRDINLDFKHDKIKISSKGTVLTNDVKLDAVMQNKLTPPYIIDNIDLNLAVFDVNRITDTLRDMEAESARTLSVNQNKQEFDISQLVINNAKITADKIKVRNIDADNFTAKLKITDKHLIDAENFKFDIAQGLVRGNLQYDIPSGKTGLEINLNNANAAIMSEALFDLKGQVYGSVNGDFSLSCTGTSNEKCFKTLSGGGNFKIAEGRMPKLGSLEYLLKAGNIFKSGLTGLSINSLVDLITPLKTGEFESISGNIHIKDGIADDINIYSSGNDLNMYMTGNYNISTSIADMEIFGSLSKNITTVFGKIKNASLNTLFNTIINDNTEQLLLQEEISKIPNIKDATDIFRIFAVEINGDINGNNYVRSFKWVK